MVVLLHSSSPSTLETTPHDRRPGRGDLARTRSRRFMRCDRLALVGLLAALSLQSLISLGILGLVIPRAVNVFA